MRTTEILLVCFAVSVRVTLLSHGITIAREERAVTRTEPKRYADVTHELRESAYRAEGPAARPRLSGILRELFLKTARELTRKPNISNRSQD